MNLIPFAVLTFCINHIAAQVNVRNPSDGRSINLSSGGVNSHKVMVEDTPDIFFIQRPVKKDKTYNEFLSYLYRNDKAKSKVKREIQSAETVNNDVARNKRAIIFRPLFVYKQQEIKRQRVVEDKKKNTKKPIKPTKKSQG